MPLPDFDAVRDILIRAKRIDQSWGEFFKESRHGPDHPFRNVLKQEEGIAIKPSLIEALSDWDFYASPSLDMAAAEHNVKSWQVIEYIEALRESLSIDQSDLIVSEPHGSAQPANTNAAEASATPTVGPATMQQGGEQAQGDAGAARRNVAPDIPPPPLAAMPAGSSKLLFALLGLVSILVIVIICLIAKIDGQKIKTASIVQQKLDPVVPPKLAVDPSSSQSKPQSAPDEQVYFTGIALPITNRLCNRKGSFCIYNLATLVNTGEGLSTYSFSEDSNGQQVTINGIITISKIERVDHTRKITFAFRDDQKMTTPDWAAAGTFHIDQDSSTSKPGIMTRFITTESFGSKTPVGLENTAYLFPN